jgi:RHS repeat-associated protein
MQTGDKTLFFWLGENLITECHADDADFSVEVIRNEHTKAQDYRCISYIYEPGSTGFRPMAQLVGRGRGGQIYYYLNDQLGTPQELITANGDIVWSGVYKSYGNLAIEYRTVPQNLRFQGQYFDEESGLHYNRYRYYDPYTARYISQDPIGLAGGENAYSYVPNPLAWIDPLGLSGLSGLSDECPGINGNNLPPLTAEQQQLIKNAENISTAKAGKQVAVPRDLNEQIFWRQVEKKPANGQILSGMNNDPRFPESAGFKKMSAAHRLPDGKYIDIHYQYNSYTGKAYDIKIVTPQRVQTDPRKVIKDIKDKVK